VTADFVPIVCKVEVKVGGLTGVSDGRVTAVNWAAIER